MRLTATERDALDLLVQRWGATRSQIVRSMIVGATLSELDQLDALDAIKPSFDALFDAPSIDDVLLALDRSRMSGRAATTCRGTGSDHGQ